MKSMSLASFAVLVAACALRRGLDGSTAATASSAAS